MSIEINSIKNIPSPPTDEQKAGIAFKTKPLLQDKVEISSKKKWLSDGVKIGIGIGALALIGVGIYKRKSLKNFFEKLFGKGGKKSEKLKKANEGEKQKTIGTSFLPYVADFKNIDEAKEYFESIGIKTVFKDGSERHLSDLNNIKNDLIILEKNGVALPKPESIIVSDWHNTEELKEICRQFNIAEKEQIATCSYYSGFWGTVTKSSDNKNHVLINSSFGSDYGKFIHEMGHIHQDHLNSSYWHSKGLNDKEFMQKQIEVLGLSDIHLTPEILYMPKDYISSILRYHHLSSDMSNEAKEKIFRMFPNINENDFIKVFLVPNKNGKTYCINATKMVDKMASESGVYAPTKTWENVAEIFQGLNKGEKYSDLVMLMYDINGGGRVPNLVIKGKKYDDYIESLYNNPDLIRQLRESIEVKELV